jgi:tRNA-splicing ligase RtcB
MKGDKEEMKKLESLIPIHELEQEAQNQIYFNLALEFLEKLAIMPDCHPGYLLPIGGVALLNSVISPEYVGYDIGCGMCCIITDVYYKDILKNERVNNKICDELYFKIPVGFNMREKCFFDHKEYKSSCDDKKLNQKVNGRIWKQLGTLGGGNHFIELGKDQNDKFCVTIHSGSRNPGHTIAGYYMKKTRLIDKDLPKGFFHLNSEWGEMYLKDMSFMLEYALANRRHMIISILETVGFNFSEQNELQNNMINENHNHAIVQKDNKVLHRKGATSSLKGQLGVIPGNMRDGVYVVSGLENEKYLNSSSHGAGRKGSRTWAKKHLSLDKFEKDMEGIVAKVQKNTLDECPDAYKDINYVIKAQDGIVIDVINHIKPIINIKG